MSAEQLTIARRITRAIRALLVVDVVESVRLIEQDEEGSVARWLRFVDKVQANILSETDGRLVKRLGDGLLIEFESIRSAVAAAFAIQEASKHENLTIPPAGQMLLRMGIEVSDIIVDEHDVYGRGVNLAARLTSLAGPGEIVISAGARDQLTPLIDADVEDLGECFLRHVQQPVRAYRIGPPGPHPVIRPGLQLGELLPSIAVIPFSAHGTADEHDVFGEVLAEEMIRALSRSASIHVISRLSTTSFRGRVITSEQIGAYLNANYVLSGVYRISGDEIVLDAELEEAKSKRVVWSRRLEDRIGSMLSDEQEMISSAVAEVYAAMVSRELQRARSQALPTLESYTLLMSAITLMHRMSTEAFDEAFRMLATVIERASRQAIPQAWMAKWYVLRMQQGWSDDLKRDAYLASECTRKALDSDPECSLALAIDGHVQTWLFKRFELAQEQLDRAVLSNPSDSIAWLLKGITHAFMGEGQLAVDHTERARRLSPLDPYAFYYDSLAATAHLSAHEYEEALRLSQRSLRANRRHASTLRAMAIAQWQLGHHDEARRTVEEFMRLDPNFTIQRYMNVSPAAHYDTGKEWANALRQAGAPK